MIEKNQRMIKNIFW